ncbi:MAG: tetratricopeptide repeat protein [Candidatus Eremiobacteraeota bacterium]|nr:tetratricopeptide repeat protein [Candidatus Eremiobacteraeota bacterium]
MFHFFRRFAFKRRREASHDEEPRDAAAFNKRGVRRIQGGAREEARADFEAALRLDASHAPAMMNLGNLAFEAGDAVEAVRWYEAAIAADPNYPLVHANLASAYKKLGRFDEAVRAMRRASKLEVRPRRKPSRRT